MNLIKLLNRIFDCKSDQDAYKAAMKDIREYQQSMISIRVVNLTSDNKKVVEETYNGVTKKVALEEFTKKYPECFKTFAKAFTIDEVDKYFSYLRYLDSRITRYSDE